MKSTENSPTNVTRQSIRSINLNSASINTINNENNLKQTAVCLTFGLGNAQLDFKLIKRNLKIAIYIIHHSHFTVSKDLFKTIHLLLAEV